MIIKNIVSKNDSALTTKELKHALSEHKHDMLMGIISIYIIQTALLILILCAVDELK
jgi:hypothetical protein